MEKIVDVGHARKTTRRVAAPRKAFPDWRHEQEMVETVDALGWRGAAHSVELTLIYQSADTVPDYLVRRWISKPSSWADPLRDAPTPAASLGIVTLGRRERLRHQVGTLEISSGNPGMKVRAPFLRRESK